MRARLLALFLGSVLLPLATARAVVLEPGATVTPNALGGGMGSELDSDDQDFAFGGAVGEATWSVSADTLVPIGIDPALDLRFSYQFFSAPESSPADPIMRIELADFSGVTIDVVFNNFCFGDVNPTLATRTADGRVVTLEFTGVNEIAPGFDTYCIYLRTDAEDFDLDGTITLSSAAGEATLPGPQPVPEPGQIALLLTGGFVLAAARRHWRTC